MERFGVCTKGLVHTNDLNGGYADSSLHLLSVKPKELSDGNSRANRANSTGDF